MTYDARVTGHGWRWVLLAALVGFLCSFVFSAVLQLNRAAFLAAYFVVAGAFVAVYTTSHRINVRSQVARRWRAGLLGGIAIGVVLVMQVQGQPASPRGEGLRLVGDMLAYGVTYGSIDALLLSVIPVLALYGTRPASELQNAAMRLRWAGVALLGSAVVTAAYHAGFAEFRGPQLVQPLIGNTLITLAYLVTGNPLAAIVAHVLMHAAAVFHGMETTVQLPPHY